MLLVSQAQKLASKEAEAFSATVDSFKIDLLVIARITKVLVADVEAFKNGVVVIKSATLTRIIMALKPLERSFYFAMIACQNAAEDGRVKLPLLEFNKITDDADIYREAFRLTVSTFRLEQAYLCRSVDMPGSNLNAWLRGSKDCQVKSLDRIKSALTVEQRNFYESIVNALFCLAIPATEEQAQLSMI